MTSERSMKAFELRQLGLNVIPMDVAAKRTPIVRDSKRLKWGIFNRYRPTDKCIEKWITMFPQAGWGVVTGPISNIFILDVDGPEGEASLQRAGVELPPTWTARSRNGGLHYYYQWDNRLLQLPTTKQEVLPSVDVRGHGGYAVCYPWIEKCSPAEVPLAPIPAWLIERLNKPKEAPAYRPGWIKEALENLEEGNRHPTFARLIGRLNRDGWAQQDIVALLQPHAEECGLGTVELEKAVAKMVVRYADQAAKPMLGMTAQQLLSSAKRSIPWLVQGVFPKEGVGILAGHPKIGKSWLTLDLAIAVATGERWLGQWDVDPGYVLYVDEESTQDMLSVRFQRLLKYRGLTDARIHFHVKDGFNFSLPPKVDELRTVMSLLQPKLVVFDSLNRVHRAEENSASQMADVFRKVSALSKEFGCFMLFTDHLPHGQDRFRGSSDKAAFVDVGFLATKVGNTNVLVDHKYARHSQVSPFEVAILDDGSDKTYIRWIG